MESQEADVPDDSYSGPQEEDVVGDRRRLLVISISPDTGEDRSIIGEGWQDETGALHGRGIVAVMLFEPSSAARYRRASINLDISPLTVLYARFARSPLMRAEFTGGIDGGN